MTADGYARRVASFWVESGPAGLGHLGRSIALAEELHTRGWSVRFTIEGDDRGILEKHGFRRASDKDPVGEVLVVDRSYELGIQEAEQLSSNSVLVAIEDEGKGAKLADLRIGPPAPPFGAEAQDGVLTGPRHALIRREFAPVGGASVRGPALVSLGGVDPAALTLPLAAALSDRGIPSKVLHPYAPDSMRVADTAGVAFLYRGVSVAAVALGQSLLETAALGVPAVYCSWRHQARGEAEAFEKLGTALYAGVADEPEIVSKFVDLMERLRRDSHLWKKLSDRGVEVFDLQGPARIADKIQALVAARRQ